MVYVLIPAHNNKKEVLEILTCLNEQSYKDIRIVLVDDGSTDGTEEDVTKMFPDTVVLKGNGNLWWTGANVMGVNYILKEARSGDSILLLNNDLMVNKDYVSRLVETGMANDGAIVGSTMVDYNNPDLIEAGIKLDPHLNIIINRNKRDIESRDVDSDVDALPGRGTLIPVEVFRKIGNFNLNRLPHYGADYEFTVRAKSAGYKLVVSHKAKVFAKLNITGLQTPDKKFISLRECFVLLFSKKSKTNIYYLNYVWLCSEKGSRLWNVLRGTCSILLKTIFKTIPGYPLYLLFVLLYFAFALSSKSHAVKLRDIEKMWLETSGTRSL